MPPGLSLISCSAAKSSSLFPKEHLYSARIDLAGPEGSPPLKDIKTIPADDYIESETTRIKRHFSEFCSSPAAGVAAGPRRCLSCASLGGSGVRGEAKEDRGTRSAAAHAVGQRARIDRRGVRAPCHVAVGTDEHELAGVEFGDLRIGDACNRQRHATIAERPLDRGRIGCVVAEPQ